MGGNPYAGMAWMTMQITVGLHRLGHDVWYLEFTSDWPYDPLRQQKVDDPGYAVPYLSRVAESFGLAGRWGYRSSYSDFAWHGIDRSRAEDLLKSADAVFNIAGATRLTKEALRVPNWIYFGTDPVLHELAYDEGQTTVRALIDEHQACVTYGENIGTPVSPLPPLPNLIARTRQPVLMDLWPSGPPTRDVYTTVSNWKQVGLDVEFRGETYTWSKHHEFLKFIELPARVPIKLELAMNLAKRQPIRADDHEAVPAVGVESDARDIIERNNWNLVSSPEFTMDPWTYRSYVQASRGEFTVARDLNVRLRSGWFSERSACYLAAGRPVITQDTGFGATVATGAGLFAFTTMEEIVDAVRRIESDYAAQSKAAHDVAREYFASDVVLPKLVADIGL
jgi:hypothetical protein